MSILRVMLGCRIAAVTAGALLFASNPALAQNALPVWNLKIVSDSASPAGPTVSGRRLAVLVIDKSRSMRGKDNEDGGSGEPRWNTAKGKVGQLIRNLSEVSPGIEVQIFSFHKKLNSDPLCFVLGDKLMTEERLQDFFAIEDLEDGTCLYQAISQTCDKVLQEHKSNPIEWLCYAVISDGEDTKSPKEFGVKKEREGDKLGPLNWKTKLAELSSAIPPTEKVVIAVGPDARKMVSDGDFGVLKELKEGDLPKPPPSRRAYVLQKGDNQGSLVGTKLLAVIDTQYEVPIHVEFPVEMDQAARNLMATSITLNITSKPPFAVGGSPLKVAGGMGVKVTPTNAAKVEDGVSADLSVSVSQKLPPNPKDATPSLRGAVEVSYVFRSSNAKDWKIIAPKPTQVGEQASFVVLHPEETPSNRITWTFSNGQVGTGESVGVKCAKGGVFTATVSAPGMDSPVPPSEFRVIDADFEIQLSAEKVIQGKDSTLSAVPKGPDEAEYAWFVEGRSPPSGGKMFTSRFDMLGQVKVVCIATSKVGGFTWKREALVDVSPPPSLVLREPYVIFEGAAEYKFTCAAFDLSGPVTLQLGEFSTTKNVDAKGQRGTVEFTVRASDVKNAPIIVLEPEKFEVVASVSCGTVGQRDIHIDVIPAKIEPRLIKPVKGDDVLRFGEPTTFEFEVFDGASNAETTSHQMKAKLVQISGGRVVVEHDPSEKLQFLFKPVAGDHRGDFEFYSQVVGDRLLFDRKEIKLRDFKLESPSNFLDLPKDGIRIGTTAVASLNDKFRASLNPELVESVTWTIDGVSFPPRKGLAPTTTNVTPMGMKPCSIQAKIAMKNGTVLDSQVQAVAILETPISFSPKLPTHIAEGADVINLIPGLTGDYKGIDVALEYQVDGSTVNVPVSCTAGQCKENLIPIALPKQFDGVLDFEVIATPIGHCADQKVPAPYKCRVSIDPRAQWWWWLLCLAGFILVGWRLAKQFFGNEPLRWSLEFGLEDPGAPTIDSGSLASLAVNSKCKDPDGRLESYNGWSRRDKSAYVPLWYLRDRIGNEGTEWMAEGGYGNLPIKIRNFWSDPFAVLPSVDQGWGVQEQRHGASDVQDARTSVTYRLMAPQRERGAIPRELWLRARCPRGGDPLVWIFWTWVGISVISLVVLLPVFHMVRSFI